MPDNTIIEEFPSSRLGGPVSGVRRNSLLLEWFGRSGGHDANEESAD
jgi:hypothetical protein